MEETLTDGTLKRKMLRRLRELFGEKYYIRCDEWGNTEVFQRAKNWKERIFGGKKVVEIDYITQLLSITVYDEMVYFLMKEFGEEFGFKTLEMDYETTIKEGKKPTVKINREVAENILKRRLAKGEISTIEYNEKMAYL